jgi:hypothetical protein
MRAMSTDLPATLPSFTITISKLISSYLAGAGYARYEHGSARYLALIQNDD